MKDIILFGAGQDTVYVVQYFRSHSRKVAYYVDNSKIRQGTKFLGIDIIGFEKYLEIHDEFDLVITVKDPEFIGQITNQLKENGINDWQLFDFNNVKNVEKRYMEERESFFSFAQSTTLEDLIFYNLFKDRNDLFYIDVGSAHPVFDSVTKTLYDKEIANGINIEPNTDVFQYYVTGRERDINLCVGAGNQEQIIKFYKQGGCSTTVINNVDEKNLESVDEIHVVTLNSVCEKYVGDREISFLKIDVEGAERSVLEGLDLEKWRPAVMMLEAVEPYTFEACYMNWEDILLDNGYHFAYEYGVNRYYVANEMSELDERFIPMEYMLDLYYIQSHRFWK